jgi:hypothetical protein
MESDIVIDYYNKHAQTSESTIFISMLIFVEHLDLVKRNTSKKIIVSTTGVKKLECGTKI